MRKKRSWDAALPQQTKLKVSTLKAVYSYIPKRTFDAKNGGNLSICITMWRVEKIGIAYR